MQFGKQFATSVIRGQFVASYYNRKRWISNMVRGELVNCTYQDIIYIHSDPDHQRRKENASVLLVTLNSNFEEHAARPRERARSKGTRLRLFNQFPHSEEKLHRLKASIFDGIT